MGRALPFLTLGIALVGAAMPSTATACSCMPPDLARSYYHHSDTFAVRILGERVEGTFRYHRARVLKPFNGCTERGDLITIETPVSSATCGIALQTGERYLLTASADDERGSPTTWFVSLCGHNVPLASLTEADRDFLLAQEVVCVDETAGAEPPLDPVCSVE